MKNKKIICYIMTITICIFALAGCAKKNDSVEINPNANTVGTKLLNAFVQESAQNKDVEAIAIKLTENEAVSEIGMVTAMIEPGFLNGFDGEITGFSKGCMFAPMIGSIPFVGYIFEADNPDEFVEMLKTHAVKNWNICTEADEMVVEKSGNLVYFVMAPNSFD